jgi:hypothetical protein
VNPVDDCKSFGKRFMALSPLARVYAVAVSLVISVALSFVFGVYWGVLGALMLVTVAMAPVERWVVSLVRRYQEKTPPNSN